MIPQAGEHVMYILPSWNTARGVVIGHIRDSVGELYLIVEQPLTETKYDNVRFPLTAYVHPDRVISAGQGVISP